MTSKKVLVVGAGLAGSDCAWSLAEAGHQVVLFEGKKMQPTPAQKLTTAAELVCTNSLKSLDPTSAHGLLKSEMTSLGSLVLQKAKLFSVPAGDALAVDRDLFSQAMQEALVSHTNILFIEEEVLDPCEKALEHGCQQIVIATGPLTSPGLEKWITHQLGPKDLYFYDAIAPVVDRESLDLDQLFYKDRYKENWGEGDYLNVPLTKEEYYQFVEELIKAEKVPAKDFEKEVFFESCLPIDIMAERGKETLRFSCMKPVGLENQSGKRAYAVVQLRKENRLGTSYNLVGFQNRLKYGEQIRIFRSLPGFSQAQFHHLGSVHRNTFLHSAKVLNPDLSCQHNSSIFFAGQITGVEGYTESAAMGLYVAEQIKLRNAEKYQPESFKFWPNETAIGALINYIMTCPKPIPSNINFGLLPAIQLMEEKKKNKDRKKNKKSQQVDRAQKSFQVFFQHHLRGMNHESGNCSDIHH
jgi:methylenetetrahydrofolate--tRNA-(uracil-5-)-methyltransferase